MRKVYVPRDTASVSVGADQVAAKFKAFGFEVIRNGSRGAAWLEPLVEIDSPEGRVGFSGVRPSDVETLIQDAFGSEGAELIMWLVMRAAMDEDVELVHKHYHAPASMTGAGMVILENRI